MKVIVTGATGTAGRGIIKACLADPRITKVVILARRAVAGEVESHPKTEVIMHHDFSHYPDELMERLVGAEACLWAVGGQSDEPTDDIYKSLKADIDLTLTGAKVMCTRLAPRTPAGRKFRFVLCSGGGSRANREHQRKPLLFLYDSRRTRRGAVERALCDLEEAYGAGRFEVLIARPGGLTTTTTGPTKTSSRAPKRLFGPLSHGIGTLQLGRAMVRLAAEGWKDKIVENDVLLKM
ncbi:unnamed protein product [Clonostachys rhizophaga]|uniref:NAD(P)-binding domain-containing protein n=1 Tax=Clonostachys rhizophaga TaxID=160324 RepID=A0A9N9VP56_9HYPO|nr:unnamed protein product [Clonostachys rhizophaga]